MSLVDHFLNRLMKHGELTVILADGRRIVSGRPDPRIKPVTIRFVDAGVPGYIARNPHLHAAEAYMDGRLVIDQGDVRDLLDLIRANGRFEDGRERAVGGTLLNLGKDILRHAREQVNDIGRSRDNVAHHYDIGNRLYDLFLDADHQYSCAFFRDGDPAERLEQAQDDKKAHIAAKLDLKPGQRVLDIGCGWGGMALYIHRKTGAEVTGVTLSEEQIRVARDRAEAAGVADKVRFELVDYRALTGPYDRIVSIGMFEHVGTKFYRTFFSKCRELLADDGVMLLHTIGRMGDPGRTDEFTRKYIFPGGYNPALSEIVEASQRVRMILSDVEVLRLHYAYTIDHWYDRAVAAREAIVALYDERFYRMWTFYLAGARAAFASGNLCNFQLQYIKRRDALPITRDYMTQAEARLRG